MTDRKAGTPRPRALLAIGGAAAGCLGGIAAGRALIGAQRVEPVRKFGVEPRHVRQSRRGQLVAMPQAPDPNRAPDAGLAPITLPQDGAILSDVLVRLLERMLGGAGGRGPRRPSADAGTGWPACANAAGLARLHGFAALQDMPTFGGVRLKSEAREAYAAMPNPGSGASRHVMGAVAFVVTFGIVCIATRMIRRFCG